MHVASINQIQRMENAVKLWSVADGREGRTVGEHSDLIRSLTFNPNGYLKKKG
jgi:hypothetical protein